MEQNELSLKYESMYRPRNTSSNLINEEVEHDEGEVKNQRFAKRKARGKRRGMDRKMIGAIEQVNSSTEVDNIFGSILREMEEMENIGGDDNVFDADSGDDLNDDSLVGGGDAESVLQSILDIINDYFDGVSGDDLSDEDEFGGEDDGEYDFDSDLDEGDDIPKESYGFEGGNGNPKGAQGNYDGRARKQAKTTFVKDNGDVKFDMQDTGYDPDDVEGSEGSEHGAQGNYDGKARALPKTNLVKGNGDADFGKAKTGIKTSSGKKSGNYF